MKIPNIVAALLVFFAADASANLTIQSAWVRSTPDARSAELFMQITSADGGVISGANSFAAAAVSLRAPGKAGKRVKEIALPAGVTVELAPGGYRIALTRLTRPLKLGEHVPVTIVVRYPDGRKQETLVNAEVRRRSALDEEGHPHAHERPAPR